MSEPSSEQRNGESRPRQSLLSVFGSALASAFGVQSGRKHAEDFAQGKPWVYVVVGLVVTLVFIISVWLVVKMVLKSAGV